MNAVQEFEKEKIIRLIVCLINSLRRSDFG